MSSGMAVKAPVLLGLQHHHGAAGCSQHGIIHPSSRHGFIWLVSPGEHLSALRTGAPGGYFSRMAVQLGGWNLPLKFLLWWMLGLERHWAVWMHTVLAPLLFFFNPNEQNFGASYRIEVASVYRLSRHTFEQGLWSRTWSSLFQSHSESVCSSQFCVSRLHSICASKTELLCAGLESLARQSYASVTKLHAKNWNKWFFNLMFFLFEFWESFSPLFTGELSSFLSETKWIKSYGKYWRFRIQKVVHKSISLSL